MILKRFALVILTGSALVLAYSALGALAVKWLNFNAAMLAIPSMLLYFAIGYLASRILPTLYTLAAVLLIAFIEVAVTWIISAWLQTGNIPLG